MVSRTKRIIEDISFFVAGTVIAGIIFWAIDKHVLSKSNPQSISYISSQPQTSVKSSNSSTGFGYIY